MASNKDKFIDADIPVIIVARADKQAVTREWNANRRGSDLTGLIGIGEPNHTLGKLYKQDNGEFDLLPAQFIIGQDGLIKWVKYSNTQTGWVQPAGLLAEIDKL